MKAAEKFRQGTVLVSNQIMSERERSSESSTSGRIRTSKEQGRYAITRSAIKRKLQSVQEAVRNSERLSKDDFAIRINAQT
jgi:RNase P protein component